MEEAQRFPPYKKVALSVPTHCGDLLSIPTRVQHPHGFAGGGAMRIGICGTMRNSHSQVFSGTTS